MPQLDAIRAHEDAEVVFGLGEQAVRVDELEAAIRGFEHVPLAHIAVRQDGPLVVVGRDAAGGAGQRVLDRPLRAGTIKFGQRAAPAASALFLTTGEASARSAALALRYRCYRRGG